MPLLKSQIIFVKKGSTRSFSHPFVDTHCMIFITFPIFYCASYPSFSNLLWLKKKNNNMYFYTARTQDFKAISTSLNVCYWIGLL